MKLTIKKLTQIIREEVEEARRRPEWARGGANYDPERARERWRERGDVDNFGPMRPRRQVVVPTEVLQHVNDFLRDLPESPGEPAGPTLKDLRAFFAEHPDFYKELRRQADLAYVEAKPEDTINDALHDELFDKIDAELGLKIIRGTGPR